MASRTARAAQQADEKYVDMVCARMAEAIHAAVTNLQPARLKIATGEAKGKIAYNYYAEQLYDPRCNVIQALDASGKPIITLVNYAIHPEVLGSDAGICSPDLVGPLYERLAEKGGGTGIFMNSAQGGMVTADNRQPGGKEARSWEECQRIGRLLADEALRIVSDAPGAGLAQALLRRASFDPARGCPVDARAAEDPTRQPRRGCHEHNHTTESD